MSLIDRPGYHPVMQPLPPRKITYNEHLLLLENVYLDQVLTEVERNRPVVTIRSHPADEEWVVALDELERDGYAQKDKSGKYSLTDLGKRHLDRYFPTHREPTP